MAEIDGATLIAKSLKQQSKAQFLADRHQFTADAYTPDTCDE